MTSAIKIVSNNFKENTTKVFIVFLLLIIAVYLLTFIDKIGLHGDEAFFGLDAVGILNNGVPRVYGMNKYTGILQSLLNAVFFKLWKVDVVPMRLGGIFCNLISLILVARILTKRVNSTAVLVFLLLFAQSILLLCYSKIAWEVSSFNFLFIALSLFSIHRINNNHKKYRRLFLFLFLSSTLLGAYNHIIFSSVVIAMSFSIAAWLILNKRKPSDLMLTCFTLAFISVFNVMILYGVMNYFSGPIWARIGSAVFIMPFILIAVEVFFFKKIFGIIKSLSSSLWQISISTRFIKLITALVVIAVFFKIHFLKLIDILANEVLIARLFSYQMPTVLKFYFISVAGALIVFMVYTIILELLKSTTSIWTFFMIAYLGVFSLFTQGSSIRYYLIPVILLFLFISINLVLHKRSVKLIFVSFLVINVGFVQSMLWQINLDEDTKVKAMMLNVGNGQNETSANFLNFSPVIDFVFKNKIGVIHTDDEFFIGKVFEFYKQAVPEIKTFINSATINYDYNVKDSGFKMQQDVLKQP